MRPQKQGKNTRSKRPSHKLSDHFSKRDFQCKCGQCEDSIKTSLGLVGGLELLRSLSKNRVNIVKGYQCPDSAEGSGKFKRNHHCMGIAADITIDRLQPKDVFLLAEQVPEFKGIGLDLDKNHVHVDTRKETERTSWVIENSTETVLTPENRSHFF